ncbi:DUF5698 domain-containing protein [Nitriliruptor alkaliphilus]|uniref:DUF5698 domain-containing protein n=1 Tax=Nitriliruptor alkaliphilus TaxID=427918 RepID=UPI0006991883|nr:DUF5698 domain-containing protein [Nitriliruptor alkaliphilus]
MPFDLDLIALWTAIWPALAVAGLRAGDVSLNVFKTVFVVSERRALASLFSGLEAALWLSAAGIVLADVTPLRFAGFVVGVATGTALGVTITRALQLGMVTVRVYADAAPADATGLSLEPAGPLVARAIHEAGFGATVFRGTGFNGPVDMVLSTVRRRHADRVLAIARDVSPTAFAAIDNSPHPAPAAATAGRV